MSAVITGGGLGKAVVFVLILGLLLLALIALAMPQQAPSIDKIKYRPHAVERHGADAISARERIEKCGPTNLRVKFCPTANGVTVVYWCETGGDLCPGMYVTVGGVEKTAFIRPCEQWRNCR